LAKIKKKQAAEYSIKENQYFVFGLLAVFLVLVFMASSYKVSGDDDFFWHLATGRFVVENKYVPDKDIFGYLTVNDDWIPFEWGWDVISYGLYSIWGYDLILVFRSLIFCTVFFILYMLFRKFKINSFISIIILFLLLVAIMDRLSPRPHIFTYLFFSLILYVLLSFKYKEREKYYKWINILPVIFLFWGNIHMGVLAGGLFLFIFTVSEIIIYYRSNYYRNTGILPLTKQMLQRLIILSFLSAVVLLINPHGINTYIYAYGHTKMKLLESINEWKNPFSPGMDFGFIITLYKIFLFSGVLVLIYGFIKKDLLFIMVYTGFLAYSVRAIRFTVDYEIIIAFFIVFSLNYFLRNSFSRLKERSKSFFAVTNTIIILFFIYIISMIPSNKIYEKLQYYRIYGWGINDDYLAIQLMDFMKTNDIRGRPFNHFGTGGTLVWYFPDQKDFLDSRNLNDRIFNEYQYIYSMKPGFDKKLDEYGVDYIIYLDPDLIRRPNDLKSFITSYASRNDNWKLVFWDDKSMLFLRNIPKYADIINKFEYKVFRPYNALFFQKEFEQNLKDNLETAKNEIKRKADTDPNGFMFKAMKDIAAKTLKMNF
jgi:hypothetical protein